MITRINQEKCIGCGSCQAVLPDIFAMDENNKAYFKKSDKKTELKIEKPEETQEAVDICPVGAIESIE